MARRKILVYTGKGTSPFCIQSLIFGLKQEGLEQTHEICLIDRHFFKTPSWQSETDLLIMPGGRDQPYHAALQGSPNQHIADFVFQGGSYLGICAGAYYASAQVVFEKGGALEVIADRQLCFFPGIAEGPAYGLNQFRYHGQEGARLAHLGDACAYYHGGCFFAEAEKYPDVHILKRYSDLNNQPAAIIECSFGKGKALLSGVHPEYSAHVPGAKEHFNPALFSALEGIEKERKTLFSSVIKNLLEKI